MLLTGKCFTLALISANSKCCTSDSKMVKMLKEKKEFTEVALTFYILSVICLTAVKVCLYFTSGKLQKLVEFCGLLK